MPQNINSASQPYCTPVQFCLAVDWRTPAQLCVDNDVPPANLTAFQASPVLAYKLQVAAGRIEMAATIGERYQPTDLVALVTPDTNTGLICNSGNTLIELNAYLAVFEIYGRRLEAMPDDLREKVERAESQLEALAHGTLIFGFLQTQEAGVIQDYQETPRDVEARRMPSDIARAVFGKRSNMYPPWGN